MGGSTAASNQPKDPNPSAPGSPEIPIATVEQDPLAGFEILIERPPAGIVRRFFTTQRHLSALLFGGLAAYVTHQRGKASGLLFALLRLLVWITRPFLDKTIRAQPFPVQLRRRLEILGPTYIKLGQVLSLREDILPHEITEELKNLLSQLPVVPFDRYQQLIEEALDRPVTSMFQSIKQRPLGSASIAQTHRAVTVEGDNVIIKVVKPGIKTTLERDAKLISLLGTVLNWIIPQFQPKKVLNEFTEYTLREVDLRLEGDNAENFAANFRDLNYVHFPRIYRRYSCESVLVMEFFDGMRPDSEAAAVLTDAERDLIMDRGAQALIRMLYRDGFFHADLHPGNLLILNRVECGFIDLGMIGRFDDRLRRTMLYYYYCLVTGDPENAARYLSNVAEAGPGGNPTAFRRAVEDISRRWQRSANFSDFSLAQLILESVTLSGKYRMYFPMEMVLMVKALVTFEGVGNLLKPGFDVAVVSKKHISGLFIGQFNPIALFKESLRGAPEVVDALVKAPLLITQGLRFLEQATQKQPDNPLTGIRSTVFGGFSLLAGGIMLAIDGSKWPFAAALIGMGALLALRKR